MWMQTQMQVDPDSRSDSIPPPPSLVFLNCLHQLPFYSSFGSLFWKYTEGPGPGRKSYVHRASAGEPEKELKLDGKPPEHAGYPRR